eukprot:6174827-Pleurochrysis_carterae.AAC.4
MVRHLLCCNRALRSSKCARALPVAQDSIRLSYTWVPFWRKHSYVPLCLRPKQEIVSLLSRLAELAQRRSAEAHSLRVRGRSSNHGQRPARSSRSDVK